MYQRNIAFGVIFANTVHLRMNSEWDLTVRDVGRLGFSGDHRPPILFVCLFFAAAAARSPVFFIIHGVFYYWKSGLGLRLVRSLHRSYLQENRA